MSVISVKDKFDLQSKDSEFYAVYMAVFFSFVGFFFVAISLTLRIGLDTPTFGIVNLWMFLVAVLFSPFLVRGGKYKNVLAKRAMVSVIVIMSPLIGLYLGQILVSLYYIIALIGVCVTFSCIREMRWKHLLFLVVLAPALTAYIFLQINYVNYTGAFGNEYAMLGGPHSGRWWLSGDINFHMAIANMLKNYGVASTGIDGLVPIKYHTISHLWLAALSVITDMDIIFLYSFGLTIIVIPSLFYALFIFASSLDEFRPKLVLVYITLLMSILLYVDNIGTVSRYAGESFLLSVVVALLAYPLALNVIRAERQKKLYLSYGFLWIVSYVLLGLKISTGLLWVCSLGYLILRYHWNSKYHYIYLLSLFVVVLLGFYQYNSLFAVGVNGDFVVQSKFVQFQPLQLFINRPAWVTILFIISMIFFFLEYIKSLCKDDGTLKTRSSIELKRCYFYTEVMIVIIALACFPPFYWEWAKVPHYYTAAGLLIPISFLFYMLYKKLSTIDLKVVNYQVEMCVVLLILGFAPAILGLIDGTNEAWFFLFVKWIAIAFLIVTISSKKVILIVRTWMKKRQKASLVVFMIILLPILYVTKGVFSFFHPVNEPLKIGSLNNVLEISVDAIEKQQPGSIIDEDILKNEIIKNFFDGKGFFTDEAKKGIINGLVSRIIKITNKIDSSLDYVIFVPPDNGEFWKIDTSFCGANSWLIPGLVGKPMLYGMPPLNVDCKLPYSFGFNNYSKDSISSLQTNRQICDRANDKGFEFVFILRSISIYKKNLMLDCSE